MTSRTFHPTRTLAPVNHWLDRIDETGKERKPLPGVSHETGGEKFSMEGKVLPFPGNTFICHINQSSKAYHVLCGLQDRLRALPTARYFTFLPHKSFHMTVFCGISGNPITTDGWPEGLDYDLTRDQMNRRFLNDIEKISGFSGVNVRADHLKAGYSIHAEPADQESFDALWQMRDRLRAATGLRRVDHDSYQFHISFAYRIGRMPRHVAKDHIQQSDALFEDVRADLLDIRLGPVEFCTFETMHHFEPIKRLQPLEI
nr:DUF1868 domain-containing protein [Marinicella sp. W31]MDC2878229.1 DUF1868 domain-containing protein [Marinicella sp. W31]